MDNYGHILWPDFLKVQIECWQWICVLFRAIDCQCTLPLWHTDFCRRSSWYRACDLWCCMYSRWCSGLVSQWSGCWWRCSLSSCTSATGVVSAKWRSQRLALNGRLESSLCSPGKYRVSSQNYWRMGMSVLSGMSVLTSALCARLRWLLVSF